MSMEGQSVQGFQEVASPHAEWCDVVQTEPPAPPAAQGPPTWGVGPAPQRVAVGAQAAALRARGGGPGQSVGRRWSAPNGSPGRRVA